MRSNELTHMKHVGHPWAHREHSLGDSFYAKQKALWRVILRGIQGKDEEGAGHARLGSQCTPLMPLYGDNYSLRVRIRRHSSPYR